MKLNKWIGFMAIFLLSAAFLISSPKAAGKNIKQKDKSSRINYSIDAEYLASLKAFEELMQSVKNFQLSYGSSKGRFYSDDSHWQVKTSASREGNEKKGARE